MQTGQENPGTDQSFASEFGDFLEEVFDDLLTERFPKRCAWCGPGYLPAGCGCCAPGGGVHFERFERYRREAGRGVVTVLNLAGEVVTVLKDVDPTTGPGTNSVTLKNTL